MLHDTQGPSTKVFVIELTTVPFGLLAPVGHGVYVRMGLYPVDDCLVARTSDTYKG